MPKHGRFGSPFGGAKRAVKIDQIMFEGRPAVLVGNRHVKRVAFADIVVVEPCRENRKSPDFAAIAVVDRIVRIVFPP